MSLMSLVRIVSTSTLHEVNASNHRELNNLPNDFSPLKQLEVLKLWSCISHTTLVAIANASTLQKVDVSNCKELKELQNDLAAWRNLRS